MKSKCGISNISTNLSNSTDLRSNRGTSTASTHLDARHSTTLDDDDDDGEDNDER